MRDVRAFPDGLRDGKKDILRKRKERGRPSPRKTPEAKRKPIKRTMISDY